MYNQSAFTMVNPQNGNLAFKYMEFEDNSHFDHIQRNNYFSLIWVTRWLRKIKSGFCRI